MNFSKSLSIPENNTQQYREGFFAKIILLPKVALELFVIIRGGWECYALLCSFLCFFN
ncbi:hypothetical protein HORM4_240096 [Vibrio harveyi]|nr:hypothetical protein HORM4_240096 [Vibrio harveyi]